MKCENCDNDHDGTYGGGRFCSKPCAREFAVKKSYGFKDVNCITCGIQISVDKRASSKFCKCDDCRKSKKIKKQKTCINCGCDLSHKPAKFCSQDCITQYYYDQYILDWKNGKESGNYLDGAISVHIRKYINAKYDNKCYKCGWNEIHPITGKIPLQINHIDGCSENSCEDNLELLCPNCHSLTDTFGALNRGKGRKFRKRS